jgi:hypothetical protein
MMRRNAGAGFPKPAPGGKILILAALNVASAAVNKG